MDIVTPSGIDASSLDAFRGAAAGADVIVCGCGTSAGLLTDPRRCITIGVNDIGRLFDPTYLVVVNPRSQFRGERFCHIEHSRAQALFTHLELGRVAPPVVKFRLGAYGGTELSDDGAMHYTQNSPYVACCLAAFLGARRIGLLGVDFTEHHFFARTGRHPLAGRLPQIDAEYGALAEALQRLGVELLNLSPVSRLQSLPRADLASFTEGGPVRHAGAARRRVFVVNYRFLSCGDVFADGLRHAADALALEHAHAWWDDPRLPEKVAAFRPDLLLVVHGRRFVQKWGHRLRDWRSAVWLTDEPYEVDDTAAWSGQFDLVLCNDRTTLDRHRNAHYCPVCFDPQAHHAGGPERRYRVGFIGGGNATRERCLLALAQAGLLDYVVGGPWQSPMLRRLCLAPNIPAARTAELYRQTQVVVNVFRETHHFNARRTPADAMNPRIYEALACGAAVVSERRAEVGEVFPQLPQFDTPQELLELVRGLVEVPEQRAELLRACSGPLARHRYQDRLALALSLAGLPIATPQEVSMAVPSSLPVPATAAAPPPRTPVERPAPGRLAAMPFDAPPRRNLLYHVWPVRGSTWRWNIEQLLQRIDLFNGRRLVGIVTDARSEPAEAAQAALEGHGCEFVVEPNAAAGEAVTFGSLLRQVASFEHNELSFYAHAKGVKYEPSFPPAVRRWAEVQYEVMLDDWLGVKEELQRYAMTGIFRKLGRFGNHRQLGDWHYSGTNFWMRHAHVFRRRWQDVPQFYGGVEAWPGTLFHQDQTGCMLMDHLRELPYQDWFWPQRGDPALRRWQAQRRSVAAPAGLETPCPFEGYTQPRLEQKPEEFGWWLDAVLRERVASVLFIGAGWGGEEWHVARRFQEAGRALAITTLAPSARPEWHQAASDARERFGIAPTLASEAPPQADAVFIDGEHGYRACRRDLELARSVQPRLIALHDIVDSDWHAQNRCCVSRVWAQLQAAGATEQRAGADWGGIGLVRIAP